MYQKQANSDKLILQKYAHLESLLMIRLTNWGLVVLEFKLLEGCRTEMFCKKAGLQNFTKFLEEHLYRSLFLNKVAG